MHDEREQRQKSIYLSADLVAQIIDITGNFFGFQVLNANSFSISVDVVSSNVRVHATLQLRCDSQLRVCLSKIHKICAHPLSDTFATSIIVTVPNDKLLQLTNTSKRHDL